MPFSLALAILVFSIMYLAIQKEKQNEQKRRHTQSKFGDHDCMSSTTTHK
jgi:uncharacterized membrane protein